MIFRARQPIAPQAPVDGPQPQPMPARPVTAFAQAAAAIGLGLGSAFAAPVPAPAPAVVTPAVAVVARAEAPPSYAGSVVAAVGRTDSVSPFSRPAATAVASQEPPRPDPGSVVARSAMPDAVAPFARPAASVLARQEPQAPHPGAVVARSAMPDAVPPAAAPTRPWVVAQEPPRPEPGSAYGHAAETTESVAAMPVAAVLARAEPPPPYPGSVTVVALGDQPPQPQTYTDTFTDTAATSLTAHTADLGGTWTAQPVTGAAAAQVTAAGRLRSSATGTGTALFRHAFLSPVADYDVSADVACLTVNANSFRGRRRPDRRRDRLGLHAAGRRQRLRAALPPRLGRVLGRPGVVADHAHGGHDLPRDAADGRLDDQGDRRRRRGHQLLGRHAGDGRRPGRAWPWCG
jgi:hypothetical protein